jgi:hypothetical protein
VGRINVGRVVLGGLLAGLVINISEYVLNEIVLGPQVMAELTRLNLPPIGGGAVAVFIALGFALGIVLVWMYAAIRPRFGAGPKTAMCAAATVWFLAYVYSSVSFGAIGIMSIGLIVTALVWGLVELLVAGVAGAWLYRE